jgi:opacity protein-like surface antigen
MNKKLLSGIAALAVVAGAGNASAFYAGLSLGESTTKLKGPGGSGWDKANSDVSYTAAFGMSLPIPLMPIRAEVEYLSLNSDGGDFDSAKTTGFGANAYVGLPLLPIIKPYLGFGIANLEQKVADPGGSPEYKSDRKTVPQYMIGLDLDIPLLPVAGGIEYRYIDAKFDYDGIGKVKSKIESVLVKARFSF